MEYVITQQYYNTRQFLCGKDNNNIGFTYSLLNARCFDDYDEARRVFDLVLSKYYDNHAIYRLVKKPKYAFTYVNGRWLYSQYREFINRLIMDIIGHGDEVTIRHSSNYSDVK